MKRSKKFSKPDLTKEEKIGEGMMAAREWLGESKLDTVIDTAQSFYALRGIRKAIKIVRLMLGVAGIDSYWVQRAIVEAAIRRQGRSPLLYVTIPKE